MERSDTRHSKLRHSDFLKSASPSRRLDLVPLRGEGGGRVATIETIPFDAATYLDTPERQAVFLRDALETGDAGYIDHALGVIISARAMAKAEAVKDQA